MGTRTWWVGSVVLAGCVGAPPPPPQSVSTGDATSSSASTSESTASPTNSATVDSSSSGTSPQEDSTTDPVADSGSTGAPCAGCLVERGLLVRYFIDEADKGQRPLTLQDAVRPPLDLFLTYSPELGFVEDRWGRGIEWTQVGSNGRASISVSGSKLEAGLQAATQATIEVVLRIDDVFPLGSRLTHIGSDAEQGRFSLRSATPGILELYTNNTAAGTWNVGAALLERSVVHVVLDTVAVEPADRSALFVDGVRIVESDQLGIPRGLSIDLEPDDYFVLGNREIGDRSFQGALFYTAIYGVALTDEEVATNAAMLEGFDDAQ